MQFSQGRGGGPIGVKEERGMEGGSERWREGERKKKDKERRRERKRKRTDPSLEAVITLHSLGSGLPCGSKGAACVLCAGQTFQGWTCSPVHIGSSAGSPLHYGCPATCKLSMMAWRQETNQ